jgi:tape measure domain-containing protein
VVSPTRLNVLGTMVDSVGGGLALMTAGVVAGAAAFVMIAKNVLETERTLDRANRTMTAVAGSTALGQLEMKFLMETADKTGQTFEELVGPYSKWLSAIKDTGLEGQRGRTAFEQFAASASTLGLSSQASTLALKALEQMMSKGSVQAEELRGQFGDQMPGAFKRAAESMGMTTAKLGDAMKKGLVEPGQFISKFMAEYAKSLGIDTSAQIEGLVATEGRWANSLTKVKDAINATFGITDAYMAILKTMTGWVNYAAANMQDFGAKIQAAQLILASAGETVMTFLGPLKSLADALWLTKSRGEVFSAVMTGVNAAIDFVAGKGTSSKAAAEFTRTAESIKNANDIIAETKSDRTAINGGVPPVEQYIKSMRDAKIQIKTDTDQYLEEAQKSMDRRKAMVEKAQTNLDQIGKTADDQAFNVTRSDPEEAMGNAKKLLAAKLDAQKQLGTAQDLYKTAVSRVHDLELISKKPVNNPWDKLEPKEDKGAAARLRKEAIAIREAMQEIEKTEGERDATSQGPEVLRKWKEGFEQTKEIEKWKDKLTDAGVSADKTAEIIERLSASFKGLKDAQRNVANTTTAMQFMQSAFEKVTDQGVNKFVDALAEGKLSMQTLADIGKSVVSDLLKEFIKLAAINPLKNLLFGTNDKEFAFSVNGQSGVGGLMNNLFKSWSSPSAAANTTTNAASDWGGSSPWTAAKGMAMTPGGSRFGLGSILSKPTLLNSPSGPGLAGEAGAEAIMPLTRGGDGKLGVAANIGGLGGGGSNMNVEIHNYGNTQVTTKKSSGPNGDTLKVMVRDIMMDDAHANGPISRGTQNLYGVSRIGKSR